MQCRCLHLEPSGSRAALSAVRRESLTHMPEPSLSKPELRRQLRARRRAVGDEERRQAAQAAARWLQELPHWNRVERAALYIPADGEMDTGDILRLLRQNGISPFLPVIQQDNSLRFAPWEADTRLLENRFGIPEPGGGTLPVADLDLVIMPLVGWDLTGNRLGMGGGFYDRTFGSCPQVIRVGLAFDLQRSEVLPAEAWDVRLDYVVTEKALYNCQGPG